MLAQKHYAKRQPLIRRLNARTPFAKEQVAKGAVVTSSTTQQPVNHL